LVFVGIKGSVVALNRATGQQVWATRLKGSEFVNVVPQDGAVLASCHGEIFCLDPLSILASIGSPPAPARGMTDAAFGVWASNHKMRFKHQSDGARGL